MSQIVTLKLSQISRTADLQMRESLRTDHINDMAEALKAGEKLPPVKVVREGNAYWLWDGYHRVSAHETAGIDTVRVEITKDGDRNDARWLACSANKDHDAMKRSAEDKRKAVEQAIADQPSLSNRAISDHVGVSDGMVANHRPGSAQKTAKMRSSTDENPSDSAKTGDGEYRTGRDGKKRPASKKATKKKASKKVAAKSGSEVLGPKDRKAAYTALGKVIRILDGTPLWKDAKPHLYAVNDMLEKAGQ